MTPIARKWIVAATVAGIAASGVILFHFDPEKAGFFPVCQFHQWTGLDCPGCGSQRALHALLHGQLITALHDNLLLILSLPLFGALVVWFTWRAKLGRQPVVLVRPWWAWCYVAAWAVFGIL